MLASRVFMSVSAVYFYLWYERIRHEIAACGQIMQVESGARGVCCLESEKYFPRLDSQKISRDSRPRANRNRGTSAISSAHANPIARHRPCHLLVQQLCTFKPPSYNHHDDILRLHQRVSEPFPGVLNRHRCRARDNHRHALLPAHRGRAAYMEVWPVLEVLDVAGKLFYFIIRGRVYGIGALE